MTIAAKQQSSSHMAIFICSPQFVTGLGVGVFEVITNGVPSDAKIIRSWYDAQRDWFCVLMESATFAEVPEGEEIPWMEPTVMRTIGKET